MLKADATWVPKRLLKVATIQVLVSPYLAFAFQCVHPTFTKNVSSPRPKAAGVSSFAGSGNTSGAIASCRRKREKKERKKGLSWVFSGDSLLGTCDLHPAICTEGDPLPGEGTWATWVCLGSASIPSSEGRVASSGLPRPHWLSLGHLRAVTAMLMRGRPIGSACEWESPAGRVGDPSPARSGCRGPGAAPSLVRPRRPRQPCHAAKWWSSRPRAPPPSRPSFEAPRVFPGQVTFAFPPPPSPGDQRRRRAWGRFPGRADSRRSQTFAPGLGLHHPQHTLGRQEPAPLQPRLPAAPSPSQAPSPAPLVQSLQFFGTPHIPQPPTRSPPPLYLPPFLRLLIDVSHSLREDG